MRRSYLFMVRSKVTNNIYKIYKVRKRCHITEFLIDEEWWNIDRFELYEEQNIERKLTDLIFSDENDNINTKILEKSLELAEHGIDIKELTENVSNLAMKNYKFLTEERNIK